MKISDLIFKLKNYIMLKMAGDRSVVLNTNTGPLLFDKECYLENCTIDNSIKEYDPDNMYEWFYPSVPKQYGIKLNGRGLTMNNCYILNDNTGWHIEVP